MYIALKAVDFVFDVVIYKVLDLILTLAFLLCQNWLSSKISDLNAISNLLSLLQNAPLPPVHRRHNRVPSAHFHLTSHTEHDRKPLTGPLYNEIHSKAPPHWTTHFLNELSHRVSVCDRDLGPSGY